MGGLEVQYIQGQGKGVRTGRWRKKGEEGVARRARKGIKERGTDKEEGQEREGRKTGKASALREDRERRWRRGERIGDSKSHTCLQSQNLTFFAFIS